MAEPGVYQMHVRALRFAEGWRLFGPGLFVGFPLAKLIGQKGPAMWVPQAERFAWCDESALTDEARGRLASWRAEMTALGYRDQTFRRLARNVNQAWHDYVDCVALHEDGFRFMCAQYLHFVLTKPRTKVVKSVRLTAVFHAADGRRTAVVDNNLAWLEDPERRVIRIKPQGVAAVDRRLVQEIQAAGGPLRRFASIDEVRRVLGEAADRQETVMIERGILRRVSADEEQRVLERAGLAP